MNLPHPKPIFLAPTVDVKGATMDDKIAIAMEALHAETRNELHETHEQLKALRADHQQAQLALRDELNKAHARLEILEGRWHEKLLRWVRGHRDASV